MPISRSQLATAYHEAGHVVAALRLRRGFRHVSIVGDDDSLGHVLKRQISFDGIDYGASKGLRNRVEREVIVMLAGGNAERRFTGRHDHRGASGDRRGAIELLSYLTSGPDETTAYFHWLRTRAEALIENHWDCVESIAAELAAKRKITAKEARAAFMAGLRKRRTMAGKKTPVMRPLSKKSGREFSQLGR